MQEKTVIVSPSGNFYGSEQVLYNFLVNTTKLYTVYVPNNSLFQNKLKSLKQHKIKDFSHTKILYVKLFFRILLGNFRTLYVNEGGHIKYAKFLAKILNRTNVVIHIRLLEDCKEDRIGILPKNVKLVSISNFIASKLNTYPNHLIYDPLDTSIINIDNAKNYKSNFNIGIIGRISKSKGISYYKNLFEHLIKEPIIKKINFKFYGDIVYKETEASEFFKTYSQSNDLSINFRGFVSDQEKLYKGLDMILHLNPNEPLGRIGLESWAREIPFVCFNSGGAGEINERLGVQFYSIDYKQDWPKKLKELIEHIFSKGSKYDSHKAKSRISQYFGVKRYVTELENLF